MLNYDDTTVRGFAEKANCRVAVIANGNAACGAFLDGENIVFGTVEETGSWARRRNCASRRAQSGKRAGASDRECVDVPPAV